jgi:Acetyltransferase (isoleucine patch superfamily)
MQVYNKVYLQIKKGELSIGENFTLTSGDCINPLCRNIQACIFVSHGGKVRIGNNVGMSSPCIWVRDSLTIGNNVNIGGNCIIMDNDVHQINYIERKANKGKVKSAPIVIEDDVWLGANVMVLKGVTIGARSIIGAGSVVTKSIPADCIAAGNPCKMVKILSN